MADEETPQETTAPEVVDPPTDPGEAELGDAGKRAIQREREARKELEARLKELEPLAAKAKELEESQKSEAQRLQERAEAAERAAQEANAQLLRRDVAASKGLPPQLAARLRGTTTEELEADADELLAIVAPKPPAAGRAGDALVGTRTPPAAAPDADAIVDKLRAAGRL
jgi:hypothetical protein